MALGRPTTLTPEIQEKICALVAKGNYVMTAARAAGVKPCTVTKWIQRGRAGNRNYIQFVEAIKSARAEAEAQMVAAIREAGHGYRVKKIRTLTHPDGTIERVVETTWRRDWQALAWILERTRPKQYARRDGLAVTGQVTHAHSWLEVMTRAIREHDAATLVASS